MALASFRSVSKEIEQADSAETVTQIHARLAHGSLEKSLQEIYCGLQAVARAVRGACPDQDHAAALEDELRKTASGWVSSALLWKSMMDSATGVHAAWVKAAEEMSRSAAAHGAAWRPDSLKLKR